jgi:hypothetical protein
MTWQPAVRAALPESFRTFLHPHQETSFMNQSPLHNPAGNRRARWPFLLAAMAVAFSLAACGGGSDDSDTPPADSGTPPTQPSTPSTPSTPDQPPQPVLHCAP